MAQKLQIHEERRGGKKRYRQWNRQDFRKPAVESDSWLILPLKSLFSRFGHVTRACSLSITMARPFAPSLPFPLVLGTDSLHSLHSLIQSLDLDGSARPVTPVQ